MYHIVLAFISALLLCYLAIPSIIHVAHSRNLYDVPAARNSHSSKVPTLGGIGIFAGIIFAVVLWTPFQLFTELQYILFAMMLVFLLGAKDDLSPISPFTKFMGQLIAVFVLVFKANIRLTSFYGIFGLYELPEIASILLSMFTILVIINSFNLIDGINGLSASIATLISISLGTWFFLVDQVQLSILAFAMAGSAIAFLKYNITPARIFMGDSGALTLGLISSILAIRFIESHQFLQDSPYSFKAAPAIAFGVLILPLFDTLRVFVTRLMRRRSPFYPDRSHVHHLLIDCGLSHMQATMVLILVNLCFIFLVVKFQGIGTANLLFLMIILGFILSTWLEYRVTQLRKINQSL